MKQCIKLVAIVLLATSHAALAANDAALLKDMTAVIALLGLPCGQVVSAVRQGESDHLATCKDGNRYRVFVNAEGRVMAQKQ